MSQTVADTDQAPPVERPCGQYKVHQKGCSLTVTVPGSILLRANTVTLREGFYQDQTIYLKAVPDSDGPEPPSVVTIDTGETIIEGPVSSRLFAVRGGNEGQRLTVPADCQTDRFAEQTHPMVVSARVATGVAYLKFIPECLYEAADSIATADIVAAEQRLSR